MQAIEVDGIVRLIWTMNHDWTGLPLCLCFVPFINQSPSQSVLHAYPALLVILP